MQKVDVFELARTGGIVEGRLPIRELRRLNVELIDGSGAIGYRFQGRIDDLGRPAAEMHVAGSLPLRCDRCAEAVAIPIDRRTAFFFVEQETDLASLPVTVEDDPEPLLGSVQFDLEALIEDEAILAIPLSPRHDKCPVKDGQSARSGSPGAPKPFAELEGLLRKNGR